VKRGVGGGGGCRVLQDVGISLIYGTMLEPEDVGFRVLKEVRINLQATE
jgi:hypothetical protein